MATWWFRNFLSSSRGLNCRSSRRPFNYEKWFFISFVDASMQSWNECTSGRPLISSRPTTLLFFDEKSHKQSGWRLNSPLRQSPSISAITENDNLALAWSSILVFACLRLEKVSLDDWETREPIEQITFGVNNIFGSTGLSFSPNFVVQSTRNSTPNRLVSNKREICSLEQLRNLHQQDFYGILSNLRRVLLFSY